MLGLPIRPTSAHHQRRFTIHERHLVHALLDVKLLRGEVAPLRFGHLLITRDQYLEALTANGLAYTSKIDFVRFKGTALQDVLSSRGQLINLKGDFLARVFVARDQNAIV